MKVDLVRQKKCWALKPAFRAQRVITRLSRSRWIPGCEVEEMVWKICKRISPMPHSVERHVVREECYRIGIFMGRPPAYTFEPFYRKALNELAHIKKSKGAKVEMVLLSLEIERKQHEQRNH